MAGSRSTVGNCNAQDSVTVFVCHSSQDMDAVTSLSRELRRYSYTPFCDRAVSSQGLEVHDTFHGRIKNMDTCKLGLILWSKSFLKDFSTDTALGLQTLAEHNIPVLNLLYELDVSDLKDLAKSEWWSEPDSVKGKLWSEPDSVKGKLWSKLTGVRDRPIKEQIVEPARSTEESTRFEEEHTMDLARSDKEPITSSKEQIFSLPWTNTWSAHDITIKISKWIANLDATNTLVYDRMATNFADYARLVADKVAHIVFLKIRSSNGEQAQDKEELYQQVLKDVYFPARDYPVLRTECKLVTVSCTSADSCDVIVSMLAAELKKMSYKVIITGRDCSDAEKSQILLRSSLRLFVLSDSFFRTEDCMMEVVKNAHAPMISLFYNLSMSEFGDEKRRELWREEWSRWKLLEGGVELLEKAVEALGSCDGIEYSSETSNMKDLLEAVAKAVSHLVPLQVFWSDKSSQVQGKIQMCEKVDALFWSKALLIHGGTQVLGLHGIWGVGKSSLGKALCEFYSPEFKGRVCYVELGLTRLSDSTGMRLDEQKRILQNLFEADAKFLKWCVRDLDQANAYWDYCLRKASKKVFLVIDNIQDSPQSFEEARNLFTRKASFPSGSKVLLLARSPHTLRGLLQPFESFSGSVVDFPWSFLHTVHDRIFCQAVDWAGGAHSSALAVLKNFQNFLPEFCKSGHPLTIKSFAFFARSINPLVWDLAPETELVSEHFEPHGKEGPQALLIIWKHLGRLVKDGLFDCVFETLQRSYDLFDSKEQQFFLDVALYLPSTSIHQLRQLHDSVDELFSTTIKCLRKLRGEAFLMFMGREIQMPAVCRCFAERMVQRDWSAQMMHKARESVQWACMHDNVLKASNLARIALESCHFVQGDDKHECLTLDLSSCKYLSVLRLWGNMSEKRIEVRLGNYTVLKCLEVLCNTCPITITGNRLHVECFKGDYAVLGVTCLDFNVILPKSILVLEIFMPTGNINLHHLTNCINVTVLRLHGQVNYDFCTSNGFISRGCRWNGFGKFINLKYLISLRELVLEDVEELSNITGLSHLCNLRVLHLGGLNDLEDLTGMEELSKLEEFHLLDCGRLLYIALPGSSRLRHCCIYRCERLRHIDIREAEAAGKSGDSSDEEDEGLAEENRCWLQYDANMWRGWSKSGSLLLHPDGYAYEDHREDQCRRCFRFDTPAGSVCLGPTFNSGEPHVHKFKVWGCPLESVDSLSALPKIHVFEFYQQHSFSNDLWDLLLGQDLVKVDYKYHPWSIRGFAIEKGAPGRFTGFAKLSYLDVEFEGYKGELIMLFLGQGWLDGLKKLAIECLDSITCGCGRHPPTFFWLPKSVRELKYRCPCVRNLSGMNSLVQVTSLDLEGCQNVERWPDFSKMRSLSVLNLRNTSWKAPHPFNS